MGKTYKNKFNYNLNNNEGEAIASPNPAIKLSNITKSFGAVLANDNISINVSKGSIHGIVGENGAGKSTLMSILYGFYEADSGIIEIDGKQINIKNSSDAISAGIGMVHQHFMLIDTFSVLENIMLGAESGALINKSINDARAELSRLEKEYGLHVDPDSLISDIPVGEQQRVEILKALYRGANILILDEPTGVLTPQEADKLFYILKSLKNQGVSIILITHKLREIMDITDNVSVMRQGKMVAHRKTSDTNSMELAELMVGRKVRLDIDKSPAKLGKIMLSTNGLGVKDRHGTTRLDDINLTVHAGEIVGIAGVSGNGQSQLLEILSGISKPTTGSININGCEIDRNHSFNPEKMRQMRLNHVPEDRHKLGLVTAFDARDSIILGYQSDKKYNNNILQNYNNITDDCNEMMTDFDIRPHDPYLKSANFSGGNQQKIILAREMGKQPDILLVGQQTRGVDIGAIEFIHQQLISMRDAGCAILLISVELEEIMSLSDRILVMFDGRIVGEISPDDANAQKLGLMMAGENMDMAVPDIILNDNATQIEANI